MLRRSISYKNMQTITPSRMVSRTAAAFPLCTALWTATGARCWQLRDSPVALQSHRPSSLIKSPAASPSTLDVSTAKGTMKWLESRCANFAACVAAVGRCESACVFGHVASQTSTFPLFQGIMEHPLGRFPSDL